eukprot:3266678-Amphidinium_carterae.1
MRPPHVRHGAQPSDYIVASLGRPTLTVLIHPNQNCRLSVLHGRLIATLHQVGRTIESIACGTTSCVELVLASLCLSCAFFSKSASVAS